MTTNDLIYLDFFFFFSWVFGSFFHKEKYFFPMGLQLTIFFCHFT